MIPADWRRSYLRLSSDASLKVLETPFIYHIGRDELYEIDSSALDFLLRCTGGRTGEELTDDDEFVRYALSEGILEALNAPEPINITAARSPIPSLRYLELHLLHQCNLKCRHCYLGPARPAMLPIDDALRITGQFAEMGGLRLLISGGEPLLHPDLQFFLEETRNLGIRRVLFTNGTRVTAENAKWLQNADEIQFSLDGWTRGHEALRGAGTFERTVNGIRIARKAGIPVSISTMIHRDNLDEFDPMQAFIEEVGAVEWGIDVLSVTGSLESNRDLTVPYDRAAGLFPYAFGGGYHGSSGGYACGRHLMTVLPDGNAVKCGFYRDEPLGDARARLADCWNRLEHVPLDRLECRNCPVLDECRGGCRFRAQSPLGVDPVMCAVYGMNSHLKSPD